MAKALLVASPGIGFSSSSGDEYNLFGYSSDTTTEANAQFSCTEAAVFSNLRARIISGGSGTNNFRFRVDGADGSQLATRAGTGDCEDASNSDTLSAGDLFNIAYTDTGTNSTLAWVAGNVEFSSGYGAFVASASYAGVVFDAASATRFISLSGGLLVDGDLNESNVGFKARGFTSFEALQVRVTANARTNDSTFKNRIENGDGSALITFTAGATGLLEDTTVGDSISDGQIINASITLDTGVEDLTVAFVCATLKSTSTKQDVWAYANSAITRAASSTEEHLPIGGHIVSPGTYTEAEARLKPGYAGTASNLRIYLSANTYTADATLKLMQNGVAVITRTITAGGGAAWYENTSDSVSFDADDEFSFELDEGTSGSITIRMCGLTLAPTLADTTAALSAAGAAAGTLAAAASVAVDLSSTGAATGTLTAGALVAADLSSAGVSTAILASASQSAADLSAAGAATGTLVGEAVVDTSAALSSAGSSSATLSTASEVLSDLSSAGAATGTLSASALAYADLSAAGVAVGTLEGAEVGQVVAATDLSAAGTSSAILVPMSFAAAALSAAGVAVGTLDTAPLTVAEAALSGAGVAVGTLSTGEAEEDNAFLTWGARRPRRRRIVSDEEDQDLVDILAALAPHFDQLGIRHDKPIH